MSSIADLTQKYDVPVPRYTSYPTAPHFTSEHAAGNYRRWLADLPRPSRASIYVHMPFCRSLCWYCGCSMKVSRDDSAMGAYADAVCREIEQAAKLTGRIAVDRIHFGGGTPTWGPSKGLVAIFETLRRNFDLMDAREIAFEVDPRTLKGDTAKVLADLGVNRVSLGVQDFDPAVQDVINRRQPLALVEQAVKDLQAAGIQSINMDLMYGLPLQTEDSIVRTVDLAAGLSPQRFALFGYAHVPWMKKHQKLLERRPIPDSVQRYRLFDAARNRLARHGFAQVGIDHFARADDELAVAMRAGALGRNFQGYTTDAAQALLGFGASAISALPQGYAQNQPDIAKYLEAVAAASAPTARGRALTADDRRRRALISDLMCYFRVRVPGDLRSQSSPALADLEADGLIEWESDELRMTDRGRPWVRVAASAFDAYFQPSAARHARAV